MSLDFVSDMLVEVLVSMLGYPRERLATELRTAGFKNVHVYDFGELISVLIAETNRQCRSSPESERDFRLQCLRALKEFYDSYPAGAIPIKSSSVRVPLLTRDDTWRNADEVYLGAPYKEGIVMESLIGASMPELFVAEPGQYPTIGNSPNWEEFLFWLGVVKYPKSELVTMYPSSEKDYVETVRHTLKYPFEIEEFNIADSSQLHIHLQSLKSTTLSQIDEILSAADPHAILGWVALDPRFDNWFRHGDTEGRIEAVFRSYTHRSKSIPLLPSYVIWKLRDTAWMTDTDGQKKAPAKCVMNVNRQLQHVFPQPAVHPGHELLGKMGVDKENFTAALLRLGVRQNMSDLTWEQYYKLLLALPDIDPDGEGATAIYRLMARKDEQEEMNSSVVDLRKAFARDGKLWCLHEGEHAYRSVAKGVYLLGDTSIPEAVSASFSVLELPRGQGVEKLARIFGAQILRSRDISVEISDHADLPYTDLLNYEITRLKPYIHALRLDTTPEVMGIGRFKRLKICGFKSEVHV